MLSRPEFVSILDRSVRDSTSYSVLHKVHFHEFIAQMFLHLVELEKFVYKYK